MNEIHQIDAMTPLIDPRITHFVGAEVIESLGKLNFETVGDLFAGLQFYPDSFQELLGNSFDHVEEQLTAIMSQNALANYRNDRESLSAIIHDPVHHKRFEELYDIEGVIEVRRILPKQQELLAPATLIVSIDIRCTVEIVPRIDKFNKDHNEVVVVNPVFPRLTH